MKSLYQYIKEEINRGHQKNGSILSDSFSHDCLHYILSNPTDTLQTFNEAIANVRNNTQSAINKIRKFNNNDIKIDYNQNYNKIRVDLRKLFAMNMIGKTDYVVYETPKGKVALRLGEHNAKGDNFKQDNADINISIYIAFHEYEVEPSEVVFTEYKILPETFESNKESVIKAIIKAVDKILKGNDFEISSDIAEKKQYPQTTTENNENKKTAQD